MSIADTKDEQLVSRHSLEVQRGDRFEFGANWRSYVDSVHAEHIEVAAASIRSLLGVDSLSGRSFLDIGSGSGLFSLAARMMGARVNSFDYDPKSVESTGELKRRYYPDDPSWSVEHGSVLDEAFVDSIGRFDVVFSWGVLHHTGDMWSALDMAARPVNDGGVLAIAIYNDQGLRSKLWLLVKRIYCRNAIYRSLCKMAFYPYFAAIAVAAGIRDYGNPLAGFTQYKKRRGMSILHDWRDWLGGYPFEVATPQGLKSFFSERGFSYVRGTCTRRLGCNELVFRKGPPDDAGTRTS